MNPETFEKIGLSKNEAKVYLALLNLGSSLAGKITEKSAIHRRAVYDALNRLIGKGLVSYIIKSGKKYFIATNPEKLLEILKEKEEDIKNKEETIKKILPELISEYKQTKSKLEASIYMGKEGLKTIMDIILKEKKDWLSIGSTGKGPEILPYFLPGWHKRRLKLKIKYRGLIADTLEGRKRAKEFLKIGLAEIKFLPKDIQNPQTIWIFGNKVAIILVLLEQPIIFLIDNKDISNSFKQYFDWLWQH